MANRIAASPLSGRIFMGRVNIAGTAFVGEKKDVTSDVLGSVIEKAEFHGGSFDVVQGNKNWVVSVAKVAEPGASAAKAEAFSDALLAMVKENSAQALALITGHFVSLTLELLRRQGHEPDGDVVIDGGKNRNITIHKAKAKTDAAEPSTQTKDGLVDCGECLNGCRGQCRKEIQPKEGGAA